MNKGRIRRWPSTADLGLRPLLTQHQNITGRPVVPAMIFTLLILATMTALVSIDSDNATR